MKKAVSRTTLSNFGKLTTLLKVYVPDGEGLSGGEPRLTFGK